MNLFLLTIFDSSLKNLQEDTQILKEAIFEHERVFAE